MCMHNGFLNVIIVRVPNNMLEKVSASSGSGLHAFILKIHNKKLFLCSCFPLCIEQTLFELTKIFQSKL